MSAAAVLGPALGELLGGPLPFRLKAWDGSTTGPDTAPTVVLRHRRALRRQILARHPGGRATTVRPAERTPEQK